MNAIVHFVVRHGYSILFAAVFARQIGLPVPAPMFLLAAGALAADRKLGFVPTLGLAITACALADWVWYEAGRKWGDRVVHFIHRLAWQDPDAHDRRAKRIFAKYGPPILVLAKFVPGLDAVAPPLAGTSRTSRTLFLAFETLGASLWSSAYTGLGFVFSHDLDRAAAYVGRAGTILVGLALGALSIIATLKLVQWHRGRRKSRFGRTIPGDPMRRSQLPVPAGSLKD
jgi:membrane protein DedA with SNARE-associated domain